MADLINVPTKQNAADPNNPQVNEQLSASETNEIVNKTNTAINELNVNTSDIAGLSSDKADKSNVLQRDNTVPFIPTADYHPATAKFVSDTLTSLTGQQFKGDIDCSGDPNYPSGEVGDYYYVTVAGKIGGASGTSVNIGDVIRCKVDNLGGDQATAGSYWFIVEGNINKATLSESEVGTEDSKYLTSYTAFNGWLSWVVNKAVAGLSTTANTIVGAINELFANTPTDDEADALQYAENPSQANPFVTDTYLQSQLGASGVIPNSYKSIYVSQGNGNDSNDGRTLEKPRLTITAAITAAVGLSPSSSNRVVIFTDGNFAESFTLPQYVYIIGLNTSITGEVILNPDTYIKIKELRADGFEAIDTVASGQGQIDIDIDYIFGSANRSPILLRNDNSTVFIKSKIIETDQATAISTTNLTDSHINLQIGDIVINTSGTALSVEDTNTVVGFIGRIYEPGTIGGSNGIVTSDTSVVDLNIGKIDTEVAYNVGVGTTLNLFINQISGTETNNGTANVTVAGVAGGLSEPVTKIDFDTNPSVVHQEGRVFYSNSKKALSYYNDETDVEVNLGQEVLFRVENQSGSTILNGSVIYPDPSIIVGLADASDKSKSRLIAVATHDIPDGSTGYATKLGQVGGLNTSAYVPGTILYLSAITPGTFTDTRPDDGAYSVIVGVVDVQDAVNGLITVDTRVSDLTVEVTDTNGFSVEQKNACTLSIDDVTRTFSIAPTGSMFHFYETGEKYQKTSQEDVVFTNSEGEHWFYYDSGVLSTLHEPSDAQKQDIILNHAFVAAIYWDATNTTHLIDIQDERHGISMSPYTHLYLHLTRGSQWVSGFGLGDIIPDDSGDLDTHAQFSVTAGVYFDEDISHEGDVLAVGDTIPVIYLDGASANMRQDTQTGFAVLNAPAGRLYYNQFTGGAWQLTEVNNNDFVLYHIFTFNGIDTNIISIMGQSEYSSLGNARAGATTEISNIITQLPLAEIIPIATIIFQTSNGYDNTVKARIVTTDTGDNYIDWRTTELSQGSSPTSHANLTDLSLAGTGVLYGHIDDQAQTLYGIKTFNSFPITPSSAPTTDYQVANRKFVLDNVASGATIPDATNIIFVMATNGNDSATGLSWEKAKLTIASAITAANALTPAADNRIAIFTSGDFVEDVTLPNYVDLYGPATTLTGLLELNDSYVNLLRATATVGSTVIDVLANANAIIDIDIIDGFGSGIILRSTTFTHIKCKEINVSLDGYGIQVAASTVTAILDIGRISLNNNGADGITIGDTFSNIIISGKIGEITQPGAQTTTFALKFDSGIGNLNINKIDAVSAYDISADSVLNLFVNELDGTESSNGGENVTKAGVTGTSTWLGLTDTPSSYSGQGDKFVKVNPGEDALEFTDAPSGGASGLGTKIWW